MNFKYAYFIFLRYNKKRIYIYTCTRGGGRLSPVIAAQDAIFPPFNSRNYYIDVIFSYKQFIEDLAQNIDHNVKVHFFEPELFHQWAMNLVNATRNVVVRAIQQQSEE